RHIPAMLRLAIPPENRSAQSGGRQRHSLRGGKPTRLTWRGWWDRSDATAGHVAIVAPHPLPRSHTRSAPPLPKPGDSRANSPARGGTQPVLPFCRLCRRELCHARSTVEGSWDSRVVRVAAIAALCRIALAA